MYLIIKFIIVITILFIFTSCGNDSSVRNETELMHRTATIVSLQQDVLNIVESLIPINNDYGISYVMLCNNGGEVVYNFSEDIFPITLNYNSCSTIRIHGDGNITTSEKNGMTPKYSYK